MPVIENIEELSYAEKLEALEELQESIWKDDAEGNSEDEAWVGEILKERLAKIESGEASFVPADAVFARLRKRHEC